MLGRRLPDRVACLVVWRKSRHALRSQHAPLLTIPVHNGGLSHVQIQQAAGCIVRHADAQAPRQLPRQLGIP